ncbi:MAG TPA: PBSX family phage terminase large subunit [archaeon]|nr:PBSX family phage terminase large subunit [archaeon]
MLLKYGPRMEEFAMRPPSKDKRINILEGSVRSGKTWGLHAKILQSCRYDVRGWKILSGVTKDTVFKNVLYDLFGLIGSSNYSYNHQSGLLRLCGSNWSVIGAKDEGSEKFIRGLTIGVAIADELTLMPLQFFQMMLTRMSPEGARFYGSTNADSPMHWLKTDYLDNEELKRDGLLWSDHYTLDDNPNLSQEYIEAQKRMYTGLFYQRYILGLWVMAEGVIFRDAWNDLSTFGDEDIPLGLFGAGGTKERVITVDYGTTNPCVFLDWRDDGKTAWCVNEYRWDSKKEMRQKTDGQYADDMEKFLGGDRRAQIIIDPSAASLKAELSHRGFWVTDARNDVPLGIQQTSSALAKNVIRFHREKCKATIGEFQVYSWDQKKAMRGIEEPIKANDHGCDSARYFCLTKLPAWRLM